MLYDLLFQNQNFSSDEPLSELFRFRRAGVENLADSSVVLRFLADVNEENIFKGKRILNKELKIAFDKAGINIPYPQVDVHSK